MPWKPAKWPRDQHQHGAGFRPPPLRTRAQRVNDMPALNFQKQFAPKVEAGEKRQTIRAERKDGRMPAKVGDTLALYTGMRTKGCRKLMDAECIDVSQVCIDRVPDGVRVAVNHQRMDAEQQAKADGFDSAKAMADWFDKTHGLPFYGHLIRWRPLTSPRSPENGD